MKTIIEILRADAEDGEIRRRDVASFVLFLIAPVAVVVGAVAGPGVVQQVMALAATLALIVGLRLIVKPAGGARVFYILGAATAVLTFAGAAATALNGGSLTLEPACTALLITAAALSAARLKSNHATRAATPTPAAG
jgi:hypothetical protein